MLNLTHIKFCAEECERQRSGEKSVYHMCHAYVMALPLDSTHINISFIWALGNAIDPQRNLFNFRSVPVRVGAKTLFNQHNIQRQLENLCDALEERRVTAEDFYQEFESIHPFVDGNGRVGAILYNLIKGTMDNPITPPNYKE